MAQVENRKAIYERIAAGIRSQRAKAHETQKELAEAIHVTQTTLSTWENEGCASTHGIWAIADHYGISMDELVGREKISA